MAKLCMLGYIYRSHYYIASIYLELQEGRIANESFTQIVEYLLRKYDDDSFATLRTISRPQLLPSIHNSFVKGVSQHFLFHYKRRGDLET